MLLRGVSVCVSVICIYLNKQRINNQQKTTKMLLIKFIINSNLLIARNNITKLKLN
jgi:hypothetical protein